MKFEHKYPDGTTRTHAPDESIYRSHQVTPCAVCRAGTDGSNSSRRREAHPSSTPRSTLRFAPDERVYHATSLSLCAGCLDVTEWTDPHLRVSVCSEEWHEVVATEQRGQA